MFKSFFCKNLSLCFTYVVINFILCLDASAENGGSEWVRDPTSPISDNQKEVMQSVTGASKILLQSIMLRQGKRIAIVNGSSLSEGDFLPRFDGVILNKILTDSVQFKKDEKIWTISLFPSVVKRH